MSRFTEDETGALRENVGYAALWQWFGLSYAGWLTLPRVLMHEMPDQWQSDMARLLKEMDETFDDWAPDTEIKVQFRKRNRFIRIPEWLCNYRRPMYAAIELLKRVK